MSKCADCGDSVGSRYHEVAHSRDVDTVSLEELEAGAEILEQVQAQDRRCFCKEMWPKLTGQECLCEPCETSEVSGDARLCCECHD